MHEYVRKNIFQRHEWKKREITPLLFLKEILNKRRAFVCLFVYTHDHTDHDLKGDNRLLFPLNNRACPWSYVTILHVILI